VFTGVVIGIAINKFNNIVIGIIFGIVFGILVMIVTENPLRSLFLKLNDRKEAKMPRYEYSLPFPTELFNEAFCNLDDDFQNRIRNLIDTEWNNTLAKVQAVIDSENEEDTFTRKTDVDRLWIKASNEIINQ